jgi:hypothetical protein
VETRTWVKKFFFDMSTQGKVEMGFELVTSASLGVVYSRLNYSLGRVKKLKKHDVCEKEKEDDGAQINNFVELSF